MRCKSRAEPMITLWGSGAAGRRYGQPCSVAQLEPNAESGSGHDSGIDMRNLPEFIERFF